MSDASPKTHAQPERAHGEHKREPASPSVEHAAESAMETPSLAGLLADPLADPSIGRHVELLTDPRFSSSSSRPLRNQLVSHLQRTYGNLHVQRVMSRVSQRQLDLTSIGEGTFQNEGDEQASDTDYRREQTDVSPAEPIHAAAASEDLTVQRRLMGRPRRAEGGLIEITVSLPASWSEFERDIGEGMGSILHTAVAGQLMSNDQFARQLMEYYGAMEQRGPEVSSLTLGIRVQRGEGTATGTIVRATDAHGEYGEYGRGTAPAAGTPRAGGAAEGAAATTTATTTAPEAAARTGEEEATETRAEGPTGEEAPPPSTEVTEAPELRLPIEGFTIRAGPVPCGPIIILPSLRLGGRLAARPTASRLATMTRINMATHRAELAQTFATEMGRAGYEYTSGGLAITVFNNRYNMSMKVVGTTVEFEAPAEDIRQEIDDWQIIGHMGLKLILTLTGNPAVIEAVLASLTAAAAAGALLTQVSRIGTGLAQAVRGLAQQALQGARAIPIIVLPGAAEFLEDLEMRRRQERGGPGAPPMIT